MNAKPAVHPLRMRRFEGGAADPYSLGEKLATPTVCTRCRAVYQKGRWRWRAPAPEGAATTLCQACRRIRARYPAGFLSLRGGYAKSHRSELLSIARHEEEREKKLHPLNRIMWVDDTRYGVVIATTDTHLPRDIGRALKRARRGELKVTYDERGYAVRAEWRRER